MPIPSLFTGAGALTTQQNAINVIANNIANVNTTAFKTSKTYFVEETNNIFRPASSPTGSSGGTNPNEIGTGMKLSDINTIFSQGSLKNTGYATDMSISGSGFFVVSGATEDDSTAINTPQYTRDGHFMIDSDEHLVNAAGEKVMGAMLYDSQTGKIRDIPNYSTVTYFADQEIGSMLPTDGSVGGLAVPTPTITNVTGTLPVFNSGVLAELSVRGGLVDDTVSVNTTTKGDLTITRADDGKLLFTFDNANAGTLASTYEAAISTEQQILDNVLTFNMANASGDTIQMRMRFEPGVTSIEDVFEGIEYDTTTATSDSVVFAGSAATCQSGSDITVSDGDLELMDISDLRRLFSPVKIPNFFYTQDPDLEVETSNFKLESNGSISAFGPFSEEIKLGRILMANFTNPDGLVNKGGNKFEESSNSGIAGISVVDGPFDKNAPSISGTKIVSGALEQSNVNLANEFAELIGFQRGLQANSRVIATSDEILQTLINL